jgi:hypothetical protein
MANTMAPGSKIHLPTGKVINVGVGQKPQPTQGQAILQKKWTPQIKEGQ